VFVTGSGKPFGWSNVDRQGLHKASDERSSERPVHGSRPEHAFISILIGQGQPVSYVADQVGDSVETTLRTYAHLFDKAAHSEKSRAAMEAAFGNSVGNRGIRNRGLKVRVLPALCPPQLPSPTSSLKLGSSRMGSKSESFPAS
jgi:hypothetical protein